jgi:hypothetical protein
MINKILELGGVSPLTREQQKDVQGGILQCWITTISVNGTSHRYRKSSLYIDIGSKQQAETLMAHNECASQLSNPSISRCFYDCSFDGFETI